MVKQKKEQNLKQKLDNLIETNKTYNKNKKDEKIVNELMKEAEFMRNKMISEIKRKELEAIEKENEKPKDYMKKPMEFTMKLLEAGFNLLLISGLTAFFIAIVFYILKFLMVL